MTTTQNFLLLLTIASFHSVTKASFISSNTKGLLAALGDFNNDKYTDIVSIDKNGTASIWFYKKKDSDGSRVSRDSIIKLSLKTDEQAVGAIPGDFNADNTLDLAVLVENTKDDRMYELKMFYHDVQNSKELEAFSYGNGSSPIVFNGQPLVLDVNGDQVPDFLGNVEGGFNLVHTIDVGNIKAYQPSPFKDKSGNVISGKYNQNCGHSFAHVVGDDQPDIILCSETTLEIFEGDRGQYESRAEIPFPEGKSVHGTPIVVDVDLDGKQEIVLPVCTDDKCEESEIYYYDVEEVSGNYSENNWKLFHSFKPESKSFMLQGVGDTKIVTNNLILKAGDVDFDGYPDFLVVLKSSDKPKLFLLQNIKCVGKDECNGARGLFTRDLNLGDVETATFFDYKEDGGNNLIYSYYKNGEYFMENKDISDKGDSAFLKVMVIGGHCGPGGSGAEDCKFGEDVNYGANLPGPTIRYETHGSDGKSRKSVWTQLSQSTHQALQSPSVIFGLGQVPNFVEKLTITLATREGGKVAEASMENVIPNSQLILIPYPPDKPSKWTFQLLLTPSDIIWKFAIALFSVVVVLGIIVLILQYQEKREDDAEKREEAHKFHFDAM